MKSKRRDRPRQQESFPRLALGSFIQHATDVLTSSYDYANTLAAVARLVIPEFADWTTIHVKETGDTISRIAAHRDPVGEGLIRDWLDRHPLELETQEVIPTVLRTGQTIFRPIVSKRLLKTWAGTSESCERLESIGTRSVICVPLSLNERTFGAFTFARGPLRDRFARPDLVIAQGLAHRAAAAIERARLHEQLKQQQAVTAFALRAASAGVWQLEIPTGHMIGDEGLAALHGLDLASYPKVVNDYLRLVHPDDHAKIAKGIEQALATSEAAFYQQYRIVRPDGETRWVEATGQMVQPEIVRGVVIDITDRKAVEQQLQHAQKLETMGRLAGGMAHDFNNVLSTIIGFTEVLLLQLPEADPVRADVQEIQTAANRAVRLSRQLLGFGRPENPKIHLYNLNVVIARVAAFLSKTIGDDVQLRIDLEPSLHPVRIDAGQFEQVLMNLAVNGRDAMPRGGTLTVATVNRAHPNGEEQVVVSIQDIGCGMDERTRLQIFEPFFSTKGEKGSGLGLPTSLKLLRDSGGDIRVDSELGRGTTFEVCLPAARLTAEEQASLQTVLQPRPRIKSVLVVDDDEGVRRMLSRLLMRRGFDVVEASTAARALAVVAERRDTPIDLLITDIVMPQGSGLDLAANVRAIAPGMPVIFVTAQMQDEPMPQSLDRASVMVLRKPFTGAQVEAAVRAVAKQARKVKCEAAGGAHVADSPVAR